METKRIQFELTYIKEIEREFTTTMELPENLVKNLALEKNVLGLAKEIGKRNKFKKPVIKKITIL